MQGNLPIYLTYMMNDYIMNGVLYLNCSVIRQKAVEYRQWDTATVFHTTNVIREIMNTYKNCNGIIIFGL